MDNAFGLTFSNEYTEDDRIVLDSKMAGANSDVNSYSNSEKEQIIRDMMEWADIDTDWFAEEMNDYFNQVMTDNGYIRWTEFFRDVDLVSAVFQQVFKAIPEEMFPLDENKITIEETVRVGDVILEKGDKIKLFKEVGEKK